MHKLLRRPPLPLLPLPSLPALPALPALLPPLLSRRPPYLFRLRQFNNFAEEVNTSILGTIWPILLRGLLVSFWVTGAKISTKILRSLKLGFRVSSAFL